jgi:O-antigen/teichoic acid export membrane protein
MASESDVGFYTVAHKTVIIVTALGTALTAVFLPRLSFIYQRDKSEYSEIISLGTKIALLLTVPACLGLIAVSDGAVMLLFGKAFAPATVTLRILAVLTVIKGVGDVLCYQPIVSSGNERILIISGIAAGAANIILSFILIPICSYNGAAIALVASELVVNGVLLSRSLKIARPKISFKFLLSLVLSNACMILAVLLVRAAVSQPAASFALSVAAGVLVYCISLMLTKNEMVKELFKKLKKES